MRAQSITVAIGLAVMIVSISLPVFADAAASSFENPLGNTVTFSGLLKNVITWLLGIVAFLAFLALIIGGIRLIIGFGNEEKVRSAKQIIFWAVTGLVVVILSFAVIQIVTGLLGVA